MHVLYFFIILVLVNISMFLLSTQCLGYYKNKSEMVKGVIIIGSSLVFTVISALIYSGMIGWNSKENYEWNLNNGFQISPLREKCMIERVNQHQKSDLTTLNFPSNLSKDCVVNPSEHYGSGCHKWTNGWNGNKNFPMTYSNWINNSDPEEPESWPRPDATSDSVGYLPPAASCVGGIRRPNPPNTNYSLPWDSYSTLGDYAKQPPWLWKLPKPGGSVSESYTPEFLNCTHRFE